MLLFTDNQEQKTADSPNMTETINVLGLPIGAFTMSSLLARIETLLLQPGCTAAFAINAYTLNLTYVYPEYLAALRRAEALYVDGASLLLAGRLLGGRFPEKLTTTDIWPSVCDMAVRRDYSFFLLGGEPGLAERAKARALINYPDLKIVGTHHGFFDMDDPEVVSLINAVEPDILWVGMGEPRQFFWADKLRPNLKVGLILTCGGMFKIVAGELKRVSQPWRQHGFEWLFRLLQEPKTWRRYLLGLPAFGIRILAQRFFGHRHQVAFKT